MLLTVTKGLLPGPVSLFSLKFVGLQREGGVAVTAEVACFCFPRKIQLYDRKDCGASRCQPVVWLMLLFATWMVQSVAARLVCVSHAHDSG